MIEMMTCRRCGTLTRIDSWCVATPECVEFMEAAEAEQRAMWAAATVRDPSRPYYEVVYDEDLGAIAQVTHPDGTVVTAADPGPKPTSDLPLPAVSRGDE